MIRCGKDWVWTPEQPVPLGLSPFAKYELRFGDGGVERAGAWGGGVSQLNEFDWEPHNSPVTDIIAFRAVK